jgi:hypothetical protein
MRRERKEVGDGYSIEVVRDRSAFDALKADLDALIRNHRSHVPFLCFDWFRIWFDYFLNDGQLLILILCREHTLVAVAPFVIVSEKYKGLIRARKVFLAGNIYSPVRKPLFINPSDARREEWMGKIISFRVFRGNLDTYSRGTWIEKRDMLYEALKKRGIAGHDWWGDFHPDLPWDDFPEAKKMKEMLFCPNQDLI